MSCCFFHLNRAVLPFAVVQLGPRELEQVRRKKPQHRNYSINTYLLPNICALHHSPLPPSAYFPAPLPNAADKEQAERVGKVAILSPV